MRRQRSSGPSSGRTARGALALLGAVAVAVLGLQAPAASADPSRTAPAPAADSGQQAPYQPVCGTPEPGQYACFALRRTDVSPARGLRAAAAPAGYGPADLQSAYDLPADGGAGQTVAIVDSYDDPTAEADLAVYREQFGLPACTSAGGCFTKVDQRGGTDYPEPSEDWAGEISLDLDMVSAAAPNAHILLVEGDEPSSDDLGAAVDTAVALGAKYVSNSYGTDYRGGPGTGEDPSDTTALDAYYDHPGVAVVASSGDYAYGVAYPAASPYVTSVGGTSLARDADSARGWSEAAWAKAGSGCSLYEPKPAFQQDTGCAHRAVADVSAVADPATGVSVYQTYGNTGWSVYGGTSASSPIIAAVYADAATPAAGTYPNAYPYANRDGLNDITSGSNGSCDPAYLCRAGAGYDGPTGLGTPNGLQSFRTGPHGRLSGTLTDSATGKPVVGATLSSGTDAAHTDADGHYTLALSAGRHDVTATAFGYATRTVRGIAIGDGASVTRNITVGRVPSETVSGKVTDGSGHGWPLYAKIGVAGDPNAVWTDPATGAYRVTLPRNADLTLDVAAVAPGYRAVTKDIHVGTRALTADCPLTADPWVATAPGYAVHLTGSTETFDSATAPPQGWTVTDADGTKGGWEFDDPAGEGNNTGGDGAFAVVDSTFYGWDQHQDTELTSPVYDFTGKDTPELAFDTMYTYNPSRMNFDVEATDDGGATWSTVWTPDDSVFYAGPTPVVVPLGAYADAPAVQLRFHYAASGVWYWGVDDVFVGQRDFTPTPGGMVVGTAKDANSGLPATGATITDAGNPAVHTETVATPEDPTLADGYFSLFTPGPGKHTLTAAKSNYADQERALTVRADRTTPVAYSLRAGRLSATPGTLDATTAPGRQVRRKLTITNTGTEPATLTLGEQDDVLLPDATHGAPLRRVQGDYPLGRVPTGAPTGSSPAGHPAPTPPNAWQSAPDLPVAAMDNIADSHQGRLYAGFGDPGFSIGGVGDSNELYVLDPATDNWKQLASATDTREAPGHGFIGDKLYIAGGWGADANPDPALEVYDTATDSWTTGAPDPRPHAGAGSAVLDGRLYLVGGCDTACGVADVNVYDPASDTWGRAADYPEPVSWVSCAAIGGKLYCAGGATDAGNTAHTYVYDPASDAWSRLADMPLPLWGSAYASADGLLVVSGGVSGDDLSNQGFAYDPRTGSWNALPNAATATYRGGGALGFYKVGGGTGGLAVTGAVENLPGFAVDPTSDVPWLKESTQRLTLRPGATATVTVTLGADTPQVTAPGDYRARLDFGTDTPYALPSAAVTLHVTAPARPRTP
ncbi:Kelch motif-containing protein [Streptomyces sp. DvalAA-14]|uniref:Kelch repeat-containing protein n=1 Tax=unclassified Streptomyces TaxID=2593676 RepID=UPI00081B8D62|nr:carboxypeptidase regulatory-like domain-containing protein [Streptomyces sp. DvalAA-14]SCE10083.1 Kelch motif-containing protein [Streptomyces sp. DvalAA-14]